MELGDAYTEATPDSASKKNITNVISGTGTYIAGLDKTKHVLFKVTADGSGLLQDHVYETSADGTTLIDVTSVQDHTHSTLAGNGGSVNRIYIDNPQFVTLLLTKTNDLQKAQWIQTVTGTGSIEDKTDGTTSERSIRLRPNGTSGSGATISYPHLALRWDRDFIYNTKLQIETATSIALHSGVSADDVTAADSNTRKVQAEVCTATNNNWWLRTADNTANTASDSGVAISANRVAITIVHEPSLGTPVVSLLVGGTLLQKTTNVPTSGTTSHINLIKHSVKNSTGADRPLLCYSTGISYMTGVSADNYGYL